MFWFIIHSQNTHCKCHFWKKMKEKSVLSAFPWITFHLHQESFANVWKKLRCTGFYSDSGTVWLASYKGKVGVLFRMCWESCENQSLKCFCSTKTATKAATHELTWPLLSFKQTVFVLGCAPYWNLTLYSWSCLQMNHCFQPFLEQSPFFILFQKRHCNLNFSHSSRFLKVVHRIVWHVWVLLQSAWRDSGFRCAGRCGARVDHQTADDSLKPGPLTLWCCFLFLLFFFFLSENIKNRIIADQKLAQCGPTVLRQQCDWLKVVCFKVYFSNYTRERYWTVQCFFNCISVRSFFESCRVWK